MIAVDLGNSRAKFGLFRSGGDVAFPEPESVLAVDSLDFEAVADWLDGLDAPTAWYVARTGKFGHFSWDELQAKLAEFRPQDRFTEISYKNIPIPIDAEFPEKVGLDRLLSVYAAFCWRTLHVARFEKDTRFLVVDAGSAITVDLLAGEGYFAGGAILPGLNAVAESLTTISSKLPRISMDGISFAVYPGKNTDEAIAAGIYWGAVGAIRQFHQLIELTLQNAGLPSRVPIILVGGDAEHLQNGLSLFVKPENLFLFPDLVLTGIALTAQNDFAGDMFR